MKFKQFAQTILAILGISGWTKVDGKNTISTEDREKLKNLGFSDKFLNAFQASLGNDFRGEDDSSNNVETTTVATLRGLLADTAARLSEATAQIEALSNAENANATMIEVKTKEIEKMKATIAALSASAELDPGKGVQTSQGETKENLNDEKQLLGLKGEMFALDRPYNLRAKAELLAQRGVMLSTPVASSTDFSRLKDDLGAFYRIPYTDRIQSFLLKLPGIETIFPLESGYQDLAVLVNIWLGEFSQADNTASDFDAVTKGNYEFDSETIRMFSVMFAHKFKNLKALEKSWIGYLNKEGSNPIKMSFIEFILVETAKKLHNEREQRRVNGIRKDPDLNSPGKAMEAADGLYEFINKKINGFIELNTGKKVYQVKPFVLGEINETNIGEKVYLGTSQIPSVLRDSGTLSLYMPSHLVVQYHKYNELHYGQNQDYKANIMYVKEYPAVKIITIPNADNHNRIIWTLDGNIKTFEDVPNEMYNFNIEQQDWTLKVWSNWKESVWAVAVGYKYSSKTDMDYSRQMIFCNEYDRPSTFFIDQEKDKNPSVKQHTSVQTVANSSVFDITDIEDAEVGIAISIKCGSTDKGVEIKKSGKFDLISKAWSPKKGDIIKLMKRTDGKFIELSRITGAADALMFAPDETVPSMFGTNVFVTGINTKETEITNFSDAIEGVIYTVHGNGTEYASVIKTGGNFVLTEDVTLSVGKMMNLVKAADGKFYELARG